MCCSLEFPHPSISINFLGDGCSRCCFKITIQEMHVWLFELLDLAVAEQMLLCSMPCAIPSRCAILFWSISFLAKHGTKVFGLMFCSDHWHRHGDIVVAVGENCDLMYGSAVSRIVRVPSMPWRPAVFHARTFLIFVEKVGSIPKRETSLQCLQRRASWAAKPTVVM